MGDRVQPHLRNVYFGEGIDDSYVRHISWTRDSVPAFVKKNVSDSTYHSNGSFSRYSADVLRHVPREKSPSNHNRPSMRNVFVTQTMAGQSMSHKSPDLLLGRSAPEPMHSTPPKPPSPYYYNGSFSPSATYVLECKRSPSSAKSSFGSDPHPARIDPTAWKPADTLRTRSLLTSPPAYSADQRARMMRTS